MHWQRGAAYLVCLFMLLVTTDWVVAQSGPLRGPMGTRGQSERDLLYVASPATDSSQNGPGILVFDVRDNFKFVKRIHTFDYPAYQDAEETDEVKGFAISSVTGHAYLGTLTGLSAFDLYTEKLVYKHDMPEGCCDRLAISPDGKILYVPELGLARRQKKDGWLVIDAATGKVIKKIATEYTHGSHNTIYGLDGSRVFMAALNSRYMTVADTKDHTVVQTVGPFGGEKELAYTGTNGTIVRPFTVNGAGTLLFVNVQGLLGFEVGDVRTGKVIHHVEVQGYPWKREDVHGEGTASHGIAMSPDEKEIWLTDNVHGVLHVFDSTVMPPRQISAVSLPRELGPGEVEELAYPYWVTIGLDGKYVIASTGHVIDAASKKIVAQLRDEFGRPMRSEKIIEVLWQNGKPVRNSDQFGRGMVTGVKSTG